MGITFTSSAITVLDGNYTFEDIYQASIDAGNTYCKKLGTSYLINIDVILGDEETPTILSAENISVIIEGDLFQITKETELRLGTINADGSTGDGVYLSCPNIKNGYGFGSTNRVDGLTQSGNLFAYASTMDIYGFWGFFGGPTQHCEVINCNINGFGRIEGPNSIIRNVTTTASNGRYGVLAPKGTIKDYSDVRSLKINEYKGHTCNVYFNPSYAPAMRVIGGSFDGYTEGLVYCEANKSGIVESGIITFVDSDIRNGFGAYYSDDLTEVIVAYTFEPTFIDENNNTMSDVQVTIVNNDGAEVFNGTSVDGKIKSELIQHREDSTSSDDYLYFDVTATKGEVTVTRRYRAGTTYTNFPFFVIAGGGGVATDECCLDDIQSKMDAMQTALFSKIETENALLKTDIDAANETRKIEVMDAMTTSSGDITTHIDNSINDSHDKYKIHANKNKDSIINIIVNGDGTAPNNQDISDKIDLIETNNQEFRLDIMEWVKDTNHKVSDLLKRWIKRGL